jgi:two-component system phosphate regulon response regulator PhoB
VRSVVYRFKDLAELRSALEGADQELPLPTGEVAGDGEWVLAMFEIGERPNVTASTASAAHGVHREGQKLLAFDNRDWQRIYGLVGPPGSLAAPSTIPETVQAVDLDALDDRATDSEIAIPLVTPAAPDSLIAPDTVRPPLAQKSPTLGPKGSLVLVVDDDAEMRDVVGAMLEAVGLEVEGVGSAEAAQSRMAERMFDMLVVDWALPGADGLELCRRVRREPTTATLPVLFLSARSSTSDVVEAFGAGADDFVSKPFRAPELGARIFALLRRARMSGA